MVQYFILYLLFDAFVACAFYKQLKGRAYIIPALLAVGMAGYQLYKGSQQKKKAKNLKESNFTPPAVDEAITSSRMATNSQMPGYARGLERLRQSTANSLEASKRVGGSSSQIQQGVADADAREKESVKDLQVADASFKVDAKDKLSSLLMAKGGYQQQSRDAFNATKSALIGAAEQNQYNAISGLASAAGGLAAGGGGGGGATGPRGSGQFGPLNRSSTSFNSFNKNSRLGASKNPYAIQSMRGQGIMGKMSPYDFSGNYNYAQQPNFNTFQSGYN